MLRLKDKKQKSGAVFVEKVIKLTEKVGHRSLEPKAA
jgi:hypothetical protein